jgi:hypothetical protein
LLFLCIAGLVATLKNSAQAWRLALPLLALVSAASAIVLFWETSPRYSHCVHFAFAGAAAVGYAQLRRGVRSALSIGIGRRRQFVLVVVAAGVLWVGFAVALSVGLRSASSYLFADIRHVAVTLAGQPLHPEPLDRWTAPWEQAIVIGDGIALPATLRMEWPTTDHSKQSRLNMSVWLPTHPPEPWASCRIVVPSANGDVAYPLRDLDIMRRAAWTNVSPDDGRRSLEVTLLPPVGQARLSAVGSITLAFGYIQPPGK